MTSDKYSRYLLYLVRPLWRTLCMLYSWYTYCSRPTWNDLQRSLKSSAMSSVCRSPGLSIRDRKSRLHLFSEKK